jgi:hypothetical protein
MTDTPQDTPLVDDVLNPTDMVEMVHPDNPQSSGGQPLTASASRAAFEEYYVQKGWTLAPDPYARPEEEAEAAGATPPEAEAQSQTNDADKE